MKLKSLTSKFFSGKKNITVIYIIVIIGVLLLSVGSFLPHKNSSADNEVVSVNANLERRISDILSNINGVGDVHVMITYRSTQTKTTAKDKSTETSAQTSRTQEENVLLGSGGEQTPFVIREDMPKILGVVVVAQGGADDRVKREITDAVKALTGVSVNNIGVFAK